MKDNAAFISGENKSYKNGGLLVNNPTFALVHQINRLIKQSCKASEQS